MITKCLIARALTLWHRAGEMMSPHLFWHVHSFLLFLRREGKICFKGSFLLLCPSYPSFFLIKESFSFKSHQSSPWQFCRNGNIVVTFVYPRKPVYLCFLTRAWKGCTHTLEEMNTAILEKSHAEFISIVFSMTYSNYALDYVASFQCHLKQINLRTYTHIYQEVYVM